MRSVLKLTMWLVLIGIGCLSYGLVVIDDTVKRTGGSMPSVTRLMHPSTIENILYPPPDLRPQKDDTYVPVEEVENAIGFVARDCLEAKANRFSHPKLAALVFEECRRLFGINVLD